jgi:TRAP-type C4-dicarboxylate transport system permease small subunit
MKLMLRKLAWVTSVAGGLIALIVGLMTVYSVAQRALITKPLAGDIELVQFGIALSISLCLAWCQLRGSNIIVDFFTQKAAPKTNRWLDGLGCVFMALMYGVLSIRTLYGALAVHGAHETTPTLDLPMWWSYACLAPGLALACIIALVQTWMHFSQQDMTTLTGTPSDDLAEIHV